MGQSISTLIRKKNKLGQAWSFDLVMAGFIFLVGIIVLYIYALNYSSSSQKKLDQLLYEGRIASEFILSEENFGILSDGRVNQTKLDQFNSSYTSRKDTFGIIHDFYFNLEGSTYGKINATQTKDLIQVTRITIYNNNPSKFEIFIYD